MYDPMEFLDDDLMQGIMNGYMVVPVGVLMDYLLCGLMDDLDSLMDDFLNKAIDVMMAHGSPDA